MKTVGIRKATNNDTFAIRQLYDLCFANDVDFVNLYFSQIYKPENTLIDTDGGQIVACAQLLPANARINSRTLRCGQVAAVMTHPDYRLHGHMHRLMDALIEEAVNRYYCFIYINPTTDETITRYFSEFGFVPAFGKKIEVIKVSPRGSSRLVTLIDQNEPMVRKHIHKNYVQLVDSATEMQIEYLKSCRQRTGYAYMLRNSAGLKIAWVTGWRNSYNNFTCLSHYGKRPDIESLISNLCRNRSFEDDVEVEFPVSAKGCHYGMAKILNDKFRIEDLDDLYPEMTFAGII
ncbi:MAG: GNAT family N-acetyltransferase [Bacteroidales bacterium]|nr:GNAT family N-acetyltransferase [Bacteroidales bacterium]